MKFALIGLAALGLAACTSTGPSPSVGGVAVAPTLVVTKVDRKIAAVSAEVAQYCNVTLLALRGLDFFTNQGATQKALDYAIPIVNSVCANPPSDVPTAIAAIANAYTVVMAAREQQIVRKRITTQ